MKKWIKSLLSDVKGLPSTRIHISLGCFLLLCYYIGYNTYKGVPIQVEVVWALISWASVMSGVSILDKGKKDETDKKI